MVAVKAAARMNPSATIKADVGFNPSGTRGTIKTVNLSDIKSGKVKLPNSNNSDNNNNSSKSDNGPSKGFKKL